MTDDSVIEEAARKIDNDAWLRSDDFHSVTGRPFGPTEQQQRKDEAREKARAAFAVFEKAHAPTDDEREALAVVIERGWGNPTWDGKTLRPIDRHIADAVLAAGFRRSEVPELSIMDEHDIEPWSPTGRIDSPVSCKKCDRHLFIGANGDWEHIPRSEPQGEPSGAQVDAARRVIQAEMITAPAPDIMRAALRAAGVVAEEPEWEYAVRDGKGRILYTATAGVVPGDVAIRRRKAGEWEPVER